MDSYKKTNKYINACIANEYDKDSIDNSSLNLNPQLILHKDGVLTDKDFYPPEDNRKWSSLVRSVRGGDNFTDYAKYFYDTYGEEIFDN